MRRLLSLGLAVSLFVGVPACGDPAPAPEQSWIEGNGSAVLTVEVEGARGRLTGTIARTADHPAFWSHDDPRPSGDAKASPLPLSFGPRGRVAVTGLPTGRYRVDVQDAGGWDAYRSVLIAHDHERRTLSWDVPPDEGDLIVEGTISAHGRPLADARVRLRVRHADDERRTSQRSVWTDAEGRYVVRGLPRGTPAVIGVERGSELDLFGIDEAPTCDVLSRFPPHDLVVVDADSGEALPGAQLEIFVQFSGGTLTHRATSDAMGQAALPVGPDVARFQVHAPAYVPLRLHDADLPERVELRRGATRRIQVVEAETGAPLAGVTLAAQPAFDPRAARLPLATTDGNGLATIVEIPGQAIRVTPIAGGWISAELGDRRVQEDPGILVAVDDEERPPAILRAVPAGTVRGRVLGHDGEPVAGATVRVEWSRVSGRASLRPNSWGHTATDADGGFELGDLPPGVRHQVHVRSDDADTFATSAPFEPAVADPPAIDVQLPETGQLEVTVPRRDEDALAYQIRVERQAEEGWEPSVWAAVEPHDRDVVSLRSHTAGLHRVRVQTQEGAEGVWHEVELDSDPTRLTLTPPETFEIRGRVRASDDVDWTGVTVDVIRTDRHEPGVAVLAADGTFVARGVADTEYALRLRHTTASGRYEGAVNARVDEFAELDVEFAPSPWTDTPRRLRIVSHDGRAVNADVIARSQDRLRFVDRSSWMYVVVDGDVEMHDEKWAQLEIWNVTDRVGRPSGCGAVIVDWDREAEEIVLPRERTAHGVVRLPSGVPAAGVVVTARPLVGDPNERPRPRAGEMFDGHACAVTHADGSFVLRGLGDLPYRVATAKENRTLPKDAMETDLSETIDIIHEPSRR